MTWAIAAAASGYLTVVLGLVGLWVRAGQRAIEGSITTIEGRLMTSIEQARSEQRESIAELRGDVRVLSAQLDTISERVAHLEGEPRRRLLAP